MDRKKILIAIPLIIGLMHAFLHPIRILGMEQSAFYLDEKITFGAFWMSGLALLTGFIGVLVTSMQKENKEKLIWAGYSSFFILLSLDEYFEIHEKLREYVADAVEVSSGIGIFQTNSWIWALLIPIVFVVILLFKTVSIVDEKYKRSMLIGLGIFMTVLLLELVGGETYGNHIYIAFVGFEETLEMLGLSLFLIPTLEIYETLIKKQKK